MYAVYPAQCAVGEKQSEFLTMGNLVQNNPFCFDNGTCGKQWTADFCNGAEWPAIGLTIVWSCD